MIRTYTYKFNPLQNTGWLKYVGSGITLVSVTDVLLVFTADDSLRENIDAYCLVLGFTFLSQLPP